MRAVVSSLPVGGHTAYLVSYFAAPPPPAVRRINAWARNQYELCDAKGNYKWGEGIEDPATFDYDLAPWISRGQLSWIAPGDKTLTLRTTADDCPYLAVEGPHKPQHLQLGKLW